jgi:vitamin B12 transporter
VVTATRVETPAKEIASSVTVITRQDLDRTRKTFVLEAHISLIGLSTLQNGGPGETASVFIRGANAEHILVLLDGIELNDPINPSRSYDLAHLPISQVDRIEILRGPQSPLYGSDALGGVINIITRKGCGRPQLSVTASAGSYRSIEGDVEISGSSAGASYSFGVFHGQTAGISAASVRYPGNAEPDGYRNFSLSGKFSYAVRKNISLQLTARSVRIRTEIDNFGGSYGDYPNKVQRPGCKALKSPLNHTLWRPPSSRPLAHD